MKCKKVIKHYQGFVSQIFNAAVGTEEMRQGKYILMGNQEERLTALGSKGRAEGGASEAESGSENQGTLVWSLQNEEREGVQGFPLYIP